jgi:hypothetical protein
VLAEVGQHAEGLADTKEGVAYLRKLADEQPQRQGDLARALTNLGAMVFESTPTIRAGTRRRSPPSRRRSPSYESWPPNNRPDTCPSLRTR